MESLIQVLLPYIKGFAGIYLAGFTISLIITFVIIIYVLKEVIKIHKKFY